MFRHGWCMGLVMTAAVFMASAATTDVSLSGTVSDSSGAAVEGALVTLTKGAELKDTTDATGVFELKGSIITGVTAPYAITVQELSPVTGNGKSVQFTLGMNASKAGIAIHSVSGRKIALIALGELNAGRHTARLPELAPGFYLLTISVGQVATTCRLITTSAGVFISNSDAASPVTGLPAAAAAAAAVDELVVSKSGYKTATVSIDAYAKSGIKVTLLKDGGGTSTDCAVADLKLPAPSAITYSNAKHPNPFKFKYLDLPKVTTLAQWECRKQEILKMTEEYLYGHMPPKCEVKGTVSGGSITANCTYNGKTAKVSLNASGSGDILMIDFGMGAPAPSNSRSATASGATFLTAANSLYGTTDMGICMASAWGVGRIIDALEQNPDCGISANKVVVTGCSTNGKQAMGAGIFEPRVAICIPVESGCGGTCSWRVSSEYGHGNSNTDCQDITHLETNWTGTVTDNTWEKGKPTIDHLPFDQDEVMALRAPGALLQIDNGKEQYKWLCNRGNTAAAQGCRWIYKALGVEDNFGYVQPDPGHSHCSWATSITPDLTKFYDKFLNGKTDVNTHVFTYNKESAETDKWYDFGTGDEQWDTTLVLK